VATHGFGGTIDLMGAPMSFARNVEIYGENEPADYLNKIVSGTVRTYKPDRRRCRGVLSAR
jgi:CRP/FNR family nitrogen fixation transcriptional regulator